MTDIGVKIYQTSLTALQKPNTEPNRLAGGKIILPWKHSRSNVFQSTNVAVFLLNLVSNFLQNNKSLTHLRDSMEFVVTQMIRLVL